MSGMQKRDATWRELKRTINMSDLAEKLGISPAAVSAWDRVPSTRVIDVERILGVPRERLRPDLYPPAIPNPPDPWALS